MPISVLELFDSAGLNTAGKVKWSNQVPDNYPGVYVLSLSSNPEDKERCLIPNAPIDINILRKWITDVPTLKLDGYRPTADSLLDRLSKFWLPDENILYIGMTGKRTLKKRIREFYIHELGNGRPHCGGHWIKTLHILKDLYIYWAVTENPEYYESKILDVFVKNVSMLSRSNLYDPDRPFPFANIEHPRRNRKKHGITGSTIKLNRRNTIIAS